MLYTRTVNPNYKMTAENIQELLERMEYGELEKEEIPKISTIVNWMLEC